MARRDDDIQERLRAAADKAEFDRAIAAAHDQLRHCRAFVLVTLAEKTDEVECRSHGFFKDKGAIPIMQRFYMGAADLVQAQQSQFTRDFRDFLRG